jgi:AcrR family transcriptional regulator
MPRLTHAKPAAVIVKQRNSGLTRQRILVAAQDCFAVQAYGHVGLRDIAARAGIDVAMVARYFSSKENLFRAAFSALVFPSDLQGRTRDNFGNHLVEMFLASDDFAIKPLQMLVRSAGDPSVGPVIQELVETQIMVPLTGWLGGPNATDDAAKILALCVGFFTYRVMVPLAPFSGTLSPETRLWLARSIQEIADRKPVVG